MKQTKTVSLERCNCGAYRYIITRDQDRVITFYLQHLFKNTERRESKLVKLFSVKKSMLDFHHGSITDARPLACPDPAEHETISEILAVITKSRKKEDL